MTNEEANEYRKYDDNNGCIFIGTEQFLNLVESNINSIQENAKLKAEINRSNGKSEMYRDMADSFCNSNIKLKAEIEQLKSELEQSVIKCTHGYDKRQNEIGETLIYCEHTDNWMNVTLGECLGNCEAEQSLKGVTND